MKTVKSRMDEGRTSKSSRQLKKEPRINTNLISAWELLASRQTDQPLGKHKKTLIYPLFLGRWTVFEPLTFGVQLLTVLS
jgi:hypothetical protein